jgi:hypothetical protein
MADRRGIPILSCGRREAVGATAIEMLKPEYEGMLVSAYKSLSLFTRITLRKVIHFIMSKEDGITNIPLILSGLKPTSQQSNLGSQDFSRVPQAVLFGGGYDDITIGEIRKAVIGTQGVRKVPWLKADQQKTAMGPDPGTKEYNESIAPRVREALEKLEREGKLDGNEDGIFSW